MEAICKKKTRKKKADKGRKRGWNLFEKRRAGGERIVKREVQARERVEAESKKKGSKCKARELGKSVHY